jgi:hypothetical protein
VGPQGVRPNDVSVDTPGNVYVVGDDDRVYRFAADGTPLGQWGGSGSEPGQFRNPQGVHAGQDGGIYVSDTNNDRVEKFSPEGRFLAAYGTSGSGPGELNHPTAAVIDRQGNLFVADGGNHRIQKLAPDGRYLATYGDDGSGGSWLRGTLVTLAIDQLNVLYVGDSEAHQVLYFEVGPFDYSGADLRDHKVQLTVDSPAIGQHIAQRLQLGVGPDARIADLSRYALSASTISPSAVGIELEPTSITFDFSQAGSGTFRGGSFNGYIFYTSNDTPPIIDVSIDPSTTLGIDAARIFWNRREIRINVQGLSHDANTVARLNLKF